jgi:hypothetical protein
MKKNMGNVDRTLRIIIGIAVIVLGLYYQSWWGALGLIFLITATISWCPVYVPFKLSTKKVDKLAQGS